MKKVLIAAVLVLSFFFTHNAFADTSALLPPDQDSAPLAPPSGPTTQVPATSSRRTPAATPARTPAATPARTPTTPARTPATPATPVQRTPARTPATPAQTSPSTPAVGGVEEEPDSATAWKNKWLYVGAYAGLGGYSYESYDPFGGSNPYDSHHDATFAFGAQVELAVFSWLSLEVDLGYRSINEGSVLVLPMLLKIGGRPGPMEIYGDVGYTLGDKMGFTFGGTLGFRLGPGVLFSEVLFSIADNNTLIGVVGYKFGLGNKRQR